MIKTLLLPGLDGSPAPHWQDWWAKTDMTARIVEQDSWSKPSLDQWLTEIAGAVLTYPGAILVGHSLGAIAAVKLLSQWPQLDVAGALLVAPAETAKCDRIRGFGAIPERALPVPTMVVASRNDPWMSFARAAGLARAWGSELVDMGHAGHINTAAGFGPWPQGKQLAKALAARSQIIALKDAHLRTTGRIRVAGHMPDPIHRPVRAALSDSHTSTR